jgi:hypothetical protein
MTLAKNNMLGKNGSFRLPSVLRKDFETPLEKRNLEEYEIVHDSLHNITGCASSMYNLFKSEPGFKVEDSENAITKLLGHEFTSISGGW